MIVTNSAEPVTIAVAETKAEEAYVMTVDVDQISASLVVDSNGAGDSFVGGFLARVSQIIKQESETLGRAELTSAVKAGNLIAGQVVQNYGCTFPKPEVIAALISAQN